MLTGFLFALAIAGSPAAAAAKPATAIVLTEDQADDLLKEARDLMEQGRYDRALERLDRIIRTKGSRTDAAHVPDLSRCCSISARRRPSP